MSQPTPYTPSADFSQQEANNASGRSTVNTAALDAEFAAIETTLDQTLNNIQLLQRDDGKIRDLAVETNALSPEVLNLLGGFRIPGDGVWHAFTPYAVNDLASDANSNYVCIVAHTSGASFNGAYWTRFGFTAGTDFAAAVAASAASAAAALASENAADVSEGNAASSASAASSSASAASSSASAASSSASSASASATAAANSAAAALAISETPVRQTVLSGPVDSNGFSAFGGATGSTTVTATGTIKATAAAGGSTNYAGSITNPSWTGLSTNGPMYLYFDIDSAGVVTTGKTTLNRIEQWGGTYSTTSGQNTFNIQEMTMKAGNGSTALQVYRVFVGEVTVSGGVVTAITWYALMGRYESAWTNTLPGANTAMSSNHNIGITPRNKKLLCECLTTEGGYLVGDVAVFSTWAGSYCTSTDSPWVNRTSVGFTTSVSTAFAGTTKNTSGVLIPTAANWKYKFTADRGW